MSSSLKHITNTDLEVRLKDLVNKERKLLHVILEHIKEVDIRKLYLEKAYSSLYEYLIKECGYSGSAAMRRLEAARLLKEVPAVSEKIQEGSLNLSQIGEFSKIIKEKERQTGRKVSCLQKQELIIKISGKSTFETQKELSLALDIPIKEQELQRVQKDESIRVELTFTKEQLEKLHYCKDLAAHIVHQEHKDSSWASLIEVLADQYLKNKVKYTTKNETAMSEKMSETDKTTTTTKTNKAENIEKTDEIEKIKANKQNELKAEVATVPATERVTKTVTTKIRKEILARDGCCQFVDPVTNRKCESTYGLQVDHKMSRWAGGDNSLSNLSVLCFYHNQHKYRREANIKIL
ncbi:MAG: HNH endonuclease [Bdellovibrio sp.]